MDVTECDTKWLCVTLIFEVILHIDVDFFGLEAEKLISFLYVIATTKLSMIEVIVGD